MKLSHATVDFAGLYLDTFLTEDERAYVTLTSICKGLDISNQTAINWLQRHNRKAEGIPVVTGIRNKAATAYPISLIGDFLDYRVSLGDKKVLALYSATFRADLEAEIKIANLVTVTAEERNANRTAIRLELVEQMYKLDPTKQKDFDKWVGLYNEATEEEKALLTEYNCRDQDIAFVKRCEKRLHLLTPYERERYEWALSSAKLSRKDLQTQAQGVSC